MTVLFLAVTCWWLTQDRSIPIFDAGLHLSLAIDVHRELGSGNIVKALTLSVPYPPFAYLVGSLGIVIGGLGIAPLVLAENLVFVPLLALGCYQVGRLAFGPMAGLLAVVFALGSPLLISQFHVFMIDAPETAMVSVSVWLVIATDGFSRLGMCVLAGLAVGLGMLTKEPFAMFVVGVIGVTALRGGRRSWRGLALFAAVALAIAMPWYVHELKLVRDLGNEASNSSAAYARYRIPEVAPARLSPANLEWYLWDLLNAQLYLPLLAFAAVGWLWVLVGALRRRAVHALSAELLVGAFIGWAFVTETFIHDTRYAMGLTVFLAVFAAGWIVRLPRRAAIAAGGVLVLVAIANTLGASFGAGREVRVVLPGARANTLQQPGTVTVYENHGFLVSGPQRDGNLLGMLQALRRNGVRTIVWPREYALKPDFSNGGVYALMQIAGLKQAGSGLPQSRFTRANATMVHVPIAPGEPPPCVKLADGTGVWIRLGDPLVAGVKDYCPLPRPHFYG